MQHKNGGGRFFQQKMEVIGVVTEVIFLKPSGALLKLRLVEFFVKHFCRLVYQGGLDCPCHLDYLGICQEEVSQSFPLDGSAAAMSFLLMLLQ